MELSSSLYDLDTVKMPMQSSRAKSNYAFSLHRASGLPQIWCRTLDPRTSFQSKWIRRMHDPGMLWSQLMVPNLCFQNWQPFFAHTFKRKSLFTQFFHYRLLLFPVQLSSEIKYITLFNDFINDYTKITNPICFSETHRCIPHLR